MNLEKIDIHRDGEPRKRSLVQRALIACSAGAAIAMVFLLLWYAGDVFLIVFAGVLLSVFFYGLSSRLSKVLPLGYKSCFAIVVLLMFSTLFLLGWFFAERVSGEMDQLTERLPQAAEKLVANLQQYKWIDRTISEAPGKESFLRNPSALMAKVTGVLSVTFATISGGAAILFIGLYLGFDPELYRKGVLSLVSTSRRGRAAEILQSLSETLWSWLLACFGAMTVVGILTALGLWALGIPLPIVLGILAGLLAFIPNIGPVLSAIPAMLVAFSEGPDKALYVALLYLAIQTVETNVITPVFQLKAVSQPPALTLSVQLLLGSVAGLLGLLLASPLCAVAAVLVQMLYIEDRLESP